MKRMHGTLTDLATVLRHRPVVIFAGAGVSIWEPSDLPAALALKQDILDALAIAGGFVSAHALGFPTGDFPRLEYVLEEIAQVRGVRAIDFLQTLAGGAPNAVHEMVVTLAVAKGLTTIYTTNFDSHFEGAASSLRVPLGVSHPARPSRPPTLTLEKLHGSLAEPVSIRTTLRQITQGLEPQIAARFENDLEKATFCFLGYAGADPDIQAILLRANIRRAFWLELPGYFTPAHFAVRLEALGKRVTLVEGDMASLLQALTARAVTRSNGAVVASVARRAAASIPPEELDYILARLLRDTLATETRQRLVQRGLVTAKQKRRGVWRYYYDRATLALHRGGWWYQNSKAVWNYWQGYRAATREADQAGRFFCLKGCGMAIDLFAAGLCPLTYAFSLAFVYNRLQPLIRGAPPEDQKYWQALTDLSMVRALLKTGRIVAARPLCEKLAHSAEAGAFVQGHGFRFLGIVVALDGDLTAAHAFFARSTENFRYLQTAVEPGDVERNRCQSELIAGSRVRALRALIRAERTYRSLGAKRGLVFIRWLRACAQLQRHPCFRRTKLFRRLVLAA